MIVRTGGACAGARRQIAEADFGVRELAPALSAADSSAVSDSPRRVAARESADESPHSKTSVRMPG